MTRIRNRIVPSLLLLGAVSALSSAPVSSVGVCLEVRSLDRGTSGGSERSVGGERWRAESTGSVRLADAWPAVIRLVPSGNGADRSGSDAVSGELERRR